MIACISSERLCLKSEIKESETIIREFEVTEEQWNSLNEEGASWSLSNNNIYLNQEPFIDLP